MGFPQEIVSLAVAKFGQRPDAVTKCVEYIFNYQKLRDLGYDDERTRHALQLNDDIAGALKTLNGEA